jgi:hypothetical protein
MRRFGALFALLGCAVALAQESAPVSRRADPATLIALLDSDDFATRDRATDELLALGEGARALLLAAREEGSLERRMRIAQILQSFGVRASSRPVRREATRVTLGVESGRLSEVAALLSASSGYAIRAPAPLDPQVTLDARGLPFFEAVDRLCVQAGCKSEWDPRQNAVVLAPTTDRPEPAAYAGPLRASLMMLVLSRQIRFAGEPAGSANLQVRIEAEHRSQALGVAMPLTLTGAIDDRGRSLPALNVGAARRYPVRFDPRHQLLAFVAMAAPEPDAKALSRLVISVPLLLPSGYWEAEILAPEEGSRAGYGGFHVLVEEWRTDEEKIHVRLAISRPQVTAGDPQLAGLSDDVVTFAGPDGTPIAPLVQQQNPAGPGTTYVATVPAGVASVRVSCLEAFETVDFPVVFENVPLP